MRMVAVQWIADVLRHPTTGVNTLVGSAPKLAAWPVVPPVVVFDEASSPWVAGHKLPQAVLKENGAGLIVRRAQPAEGDVLPGGNGFDAVTTAVHFVARVAPGDTTRSDLALIAEQTLRAARRAISIAMPEFVQETYPTLAGCEVGMSDTNTITHLPLQAELEGGLLFDALLVRVAIHDMWALGIDAASTP
jgi:hypothetical protein